MTETSLKIDADKGGHAGVLAILRPLIRGQFRKTIQKKFHQSILNRVGGAKTHRVFTLRKSEVADGELRLTHTVLEDAPAYVGGKGSRVEGRGFQCIGEQFVEIAHPFRRHLQQVERVP